MILSSSIEIESKNDDNINLSSSSSESSDLAKQPAAEQIDCDSLIKESLLKSKHVVSSKEKTTHRLKPVNKKNSSHDEDDEDDEEEDENDDDEDDDDEEEEEEEDDEDEDEHKNSTIDLSLINSVHVCASQVRR
jgi:hypothetical protein